MEKTRNDRVIHLLKTLKIDEMEAARRIGKQPATVYRITNKQHEPSKGTLELIAVKLSANYDWLLTGHGEMLSEQKEETKRAYTSSPWKDEAYAVVKDENSRLQKEIERLWGLIGQFTNGKNVNFLKALEKAAVPGYLFPNKKQGAVLRAMA